MTANIQTATMNAVSAQTDFGNVVETLEGAGVFIDTNVNAGLPRDHVHEHLLATLVGLISKLGHVSMRGATFLVGKVNAGPWSDGERKRLASVIMGSISNDEASTVSPRGGQRGKRLQRCLHFDQALTAAEWKGLRSKAMRASKIDQLAHRAWSIGLIAPSEPTSFHITSILCLVDNITCPETIPGVFRDVKAAIKQLATKPYPHGYMSEPYPENMRKLPKEIFDFAYPDPDDGPVATVLHGLSSVMGGTKMRQTKGGSAVAVTAARASQHGGHPQSLRDMLDELLRKEATAPADKGVVQGVATHHVHAKSGEMVVNASLVPGPASAVDASLVSGPAPAPASASWGIGKPWVYKPSLDIDKYPLFPEERAAMGAPAPSGMGAVDAGVSGTYCVRLRFKQPSSALTRSLLDRNRAMLRQKRATDGADPSDVLLRADAMAKQRDNAKKQRLDKTADAVADAAVGRGRGRGRGRGKGVGKGVDKGVVKGVPMKSMKRARGRGVAKAKAAPDFAHLPARKGAIATPASQGNPVSYKTGRIYFDKNKGKFRVIRHMPNYATEKAVIIALYSGVQQAWLHALKIIDDYFEGLDVD